MPANRKNQSPDQPQFNAGVGADLKTPYQEYPAGEPQWDDWGHATGIGEDTFVPLVPVNVAARSKD